MPKNSVTEFPKPDGSAASGELAAPLPGAGAGPARLLAGERTKARDWTECLLAVHLLHHPVVVPRVLGVLRRLDLHHVHVVDHHAVRADVAAAGKHVVDLHSLQLRPDLLGI